MIELRIEAREMKYNVCHQYITDLFISLENVIFWKVQSQARVREKTQWKFHRRKRDAMLLHGLCGCTE